jgi:hypothetical protein
LFESDIFRKDGVLPNRPAPGIYIFGDLAAVVA